MKPEATGTTSELKETMDPRIVESVLKDLGRGYLQEFASLSPEGRELFRNMMPSALSGDTATMEALYAMDYDHRRVDPETFFTHPDYMGHFRKNIYPAWWPHLLNICDPAKSIYEVILTGSLGSGKSTVGIGLILSYHLHRLLCLKDPASFFGLGKKSRIIFGVYSLDLKSAEDIGFYILRDQLLAESPFFNSLYRRSPYGTDQIEFPKSILVKTGSGSLHAAGKNLFAIAVDEMNLMKKGDSTVNKAFTLANDVTRRLESRFLQSGGNIPGVTVFIGSAGSDSDFIERRIRMTKGRPHHYVVRAAIWEFARLDARGRSKYCGQRFRVQVGNKYYGSKVLDEVVCTDGVYEINQLEDADEGCNVIDVPVEHYNSFEMDPDGSIKDLAGVSTKSFMKLFTSKKYLQRACVPDLPSPFRQEIIDAYLFSQTELAYEFDQTRMCRVRGSQYVPLRHPQAPRYVHIDLAKNKDKAGVAMVHPSKHMLGMQTMDRDEFGVPLYDVNKEIEVDFCIAVCSGPRKEAIDFANIRRLIFHIRNCGFWIRLVTLDSWQSEDTRQRILEAGINAEIFSLDKDTRPYLIFRNLVNAGKVVWPRGLTHLYEELADLDYDAFLDKVDHPEGGSKDEADSVAGAVYRCSVDQIKPGEMRHIPQVGRDLVVDSYLQQLKELQERLAVLEGRESE